MLQHEVQVSEIVTAPAKARRIVPLEKDTIGEKLSHMRKRLMKRLQEWHLSFLRKLHGKAQRVGNQPLVYELRRLKNMFPDVQIKQLPDDEYQLTFCSEIPLSTLRSSLNIFRSEVWSKRVFRETFSQPTAGNSTSTLKPISSYLQLPVCRTANADGQHMVLFSNQNRLLVVVKKL
ncbi:MAG: hypothetical protein HFJ28_00875 [Clostridia bacterium]|jgi:hypothetical protein|nr:hypothetical protein [Clostridia bacterium]